jgi:anti-sigma B factor antagonist
MPLEIKRREREDIQILEMKGRLTVGEEATLLRETIRELSEAGKVRIVLDLKGIDFIDSTGLGGLVICFTTMTKAGGSLKLLNLNKRNIELLLLTKLTTVFELFNDEQGAIDSFFPGRKVNKFDILNFIKGNG